MSEGESERESARGREEEEEERGESGFCVGGSRPKFGRKPKLKFGSQMSDVFGESAKIRDRTSTKNKPMPTSGRKESNETFFSEFQQL